MSRTTTEPVRRRAATAGPPARRGRRRGAQDHGIAPYLLTGPSVVLYLLFVIIPVGYTLWLSLFAYRIQGGGSVLGTRVLSWTGLSNYAEVLADPAYRSGLVHLLVYGAIQIPLTLGLALLFALLLDQPGVRARRFSRSAIFIPYAVPGVIAALLWGFMYLPSTSPMSAVSRALGGEAVPFMENPWIFAALANIAVWGGVGFNMIIIYTSLRAIPTDLMDAARLDGANERQIALRIKVPLVVPALILTGFFSAIGTLQLYNEPQTIKTMTNVITPTWVPLMTIYRDAFMTDNLPRAAAASVLLALLTVVASGIVMRLASFRRSPR